MLCVLWLVDSPLRSSPLRSSPLWARSELPTRLPTPVCDALSDHPSLSTAGEGRDTETQTSDRDDVSLIPSMEDNTESSLTAFNCLVS